jgi:hypothetical protein
MVPLAIAVLMQAKTGRATQLSVGAITAPCHQVGYTP